MHPYSRLHTSFAEFDYVAGKTVGIYICLQNKLFVTKHRMAVLRSYNKHVHIKKPFKSFHSPILHTIVVKLWLAVVTFMDIFIP